MRPRAFIYSPSNSLRECPAIILQGRFGLLNLGDELLCLLDGLR
jgi:hypothetical protein